MNYFFQTSGLPASPKQQSTAPNGAASSSISWNTEKVHYFEVQNTFSKDAALIEDATEELSPEEESTFYKKVLKASLL